MTGPQYRQRYYCLGLVKIMEAFILLSYVYIQWKYILKLEIMRLHLDGLVLMYRYRVP